MCSAPKSGDGGTDTATRPSANRGAKPSAGPCPARADDMPEQASPAQLPPSVPVPPQLRAAQLKESQQGRHHDHHPDY